MSFQERIDALKALKIGVRFCPPTTAEFKTGAIYIKKAILENENLIEAEENLLACEVKAASIVAADNAVKYVAARIAEYPPIGDQLDYICKTLGHLKATGVDIGPFGDEYVGKIEAIKIKHPKPNK